jgi:hypothetical protein
MHALRWIGPLAAALALLAAAPEAEACSCAPPAFSPRVMPEDGAENVAPNTRLLVFEDHRNGGGPPSLRRTDLEAPAEVELEVTLFERRFDQRIFWLEPNAHLEAGATYELFGSSGDLLSSFEVGATLDEQAPASPGRPELELARLHATDVPCGSGQCWATDPFRRVQVLFPPPEEDVVLTLVELWLEGDDEPALRAPVTWSSHLGGVSLQSDICAPHTPPEFGHGETLCARVVHHDGAGNEAAGEAVCAQPLECAAQADCMVHGECLPLSPPDAGPGGGPDAGQAGEGGGGGCALAAPGGTTASLVMLALALVLLRRGPSSRRAHGSEP